MTQDDAGLALHRLVPRALATPAAGFAMPAMLRSHTIYVTDEAPETASAIAFALRARGLRAEIVGDLPDGATAAISLGGLDSNVSPERALSLHLRAFHVARTIAVSPSEADRLFVTLQATGGKFALDGDPMTMGWAGGVAGIAKTAAREWPDASVKAIDFAMTEPDRIAELLVAELLHGGPEIEVGFDLHGTRFAIDLQSDPSDHSTVAPLPRGSVVVVSGGARGITALAAAELGRTYGLRLVLLGRSAVTWPTDLPDTADVSVLTEALSAAAQRSGTSFSRRALRQEAIQLAARHEARATLAEFTRLGVEFRHVAVDVTDAAALASALVAIRDEWGPVDGIVHGAGVIADCRIAELDDERFTRVFATKVQGLASLLQVTQGDPLKLLAVFSSITARHGNVGQVAYAAANEVLNKVAASIKASRGTSCRVRAFNWGPWDGGMVGSALKVYMERSGFALIPQSAGSLFFAQELASDSGPTEMVVAATAATAASPPRKLLAACEVGGVRQRFLSDNVVKDRAVLPIVMTVEWACRMGRAAMPGCSDGFGLRDLRVMSDMTAAADLSASVPLFLEIGPSSVGADGIEAEVAMKDAAGRTRYHATFLADPPRTALTVAPLDGGKGRRYSLSEANDRYLFHSRMFEVITGLESVCEAGGSALLRGGAGFGWPEEAWLTDPALLDGGMQLGGLWAGCLLDKKVLPQQIASYRRLGVPVADDPVRCSFRVRPVTGNRIDLDLLYATLDGRPLAEIRGAEFHGVGA